MKPSTPVWHGSKTDKDTDIHALCRGNDNAFYNHTITFLLPAYLLTKDGSYLCKTSTLNLSCCSGIAYNNSLNIFLRFSKALVSYYLH